MIRKVIFANKKYILSSGRDIDLTAEHEGDVIIVSAMFNILDPVQNIGHAVLIRVDSKQVVSFESLGTKSKDEELNELVKPIEGLNGATENLKIYELNELMSVIQQFLQKIEKELVAK